MLLKRNEILSMRHIRSFATLCLLLATSVAGAQVAPPAHAGPVAAQSTRPAASANSAPRFNFIVVGPAGPVVQKIQSGVMQRFHAAGVNLTNMFPTATLVMFVMQDVDSNVNKTGVTIAIAYVSNALTDNYIYDNFIRKGVSLNPPIFAMLRQKGFIYHLAAAHLDRPSPDEINDLVSATVPAFIKYFEPKAQSTTTAGK